jgi:steroid delta-isomerase-like uncharacterized protein
MTTFSPSTLGRRFFEAQDRLKGGPDPLLCCTGYAAHIMGNAPLDLAGHQAFARHFYEAFPDLRHEFDEVLADGDRVAVWITLRGTQTGDFLGIPATGKAVSIPMSALLYLADGRVARLHGLFDQPGLMRQLGVSS